MYWLSYSSHTSSSLTDSLSSLNLLCHLKTNAWFMQDGRKAVWSIPYVSILAFPSAPNHVRHLPQGLWSGFGELAKVNCLLPSQELNWLFQISQNPLRALPVHDVIHIPKGFLFWHLWMTHPPRVRQHLCSSLHLTNPCAEPKGSQPN